jgi:hypothetical protein
VSRVRRDRESLEVRLAEEWCVARTVAGASDPAPVPGNGTGAARDGAARAIAHSALPEIIAPGSAIYVDGGLQRSDTLFASCHAVGVVKSHRTLYVSGAALRTVMSLAAGHRSSVFVVSAGWRPPVASWYLRLRNPRGHEPLWGLVRVEVSLAALQQLHHSADAWADAVSRGILAESAPLALPDARWDVMVYGIRDCEIYLRSALGT